MVYITAKLKIPISEKGMEFNYGLMEIGMKDIGKMIKLMAKANFTIVMEIIIAAIGFII